MSYLSSLADKSFKVDENGKIVFFPWGYFGKGYILVDKAQEEKIRKVIIVGNIIGLSLLFIIGIVLKLWLVALLLFPFVIVIWTLQTKRFTRGLEISQMEYSINSNAKSTALPIDKPSRALRISIIAQWFLIVVGVIVGLYEERYLPEILRTYVNADDSKALSSVEIVAMSSGAFLLLGFIISSIGLYRLKQWARTVYVACAVLGTALFLFMGPSVTPPIQGTIEYLANATEGFTIALLYFSTARNNFASSNLNAREGR